MEGREKDVEANAKGVCRLTTSSCLRSGGGGGPSVSAPTTSRLGKEKGRRDALAGG